MLMNAFQDSDFLTRYRFECKLFKSKTKVQTYMIDELFYADDMNKNASSEANMQMTMEQVSQQCDNTDLITR